MKKGETFETDTDTEVIPKLCKYVYNSLSEPIHFSEVRCALQTRRCTLANAATQPAARVAVLAPPRTARLPGLLLQLPT